MADTVFSSRVVEDGYLHRVYDMNGDRASSAPLSGAVAQVFETMAPGQRLSVFDIRNGISSVRGVRHGLGHATLQASTLKTHGLLGPAGFYVHYPHLFRSDTDGPPLYARNFQYCVGECSTTKEVLNVAKAYADLFQVVEMSDGSRFTAGPPLFKPLGIPPAGSIPHTKYHTPDARFSYFIEHMKSPWNLDDVPKELLEELVDDMKKLPKEHDGMPVERSAEPFKVPNVIFHSGKRFDQAFTEKRNLGSGTTMSLTREEMQLRAAGKKPVFVSEADGYKYAANEPQHKNVKSVFALLAGSAAHNGEANERQAYVASPDWHLFSYALTCKRAEGAKTEDFGKMVLADLVSQGYDREEVLTKWTAIPLDGGPSTLQLFRHSSGALELFAKGGLEGKPIPAEAGEATYRMAKAWTLLRAAGGKIPTEEEERIEGNRGSEREEKERRREAGEEVEKWGDELVHVYPGDGDDEDFFETEDQKKVRSDSRRIWWMICHTNALRQNEPDQ